MSVTAARIGSSPIRLDWSALHSEHSSPSHALPKDIHTLSLHAWNKLQERFLKKEVAFFDAPSDSEISQIKACQELAEKFSARTQKPITDVLSLGIGGSSLGPIVLHSALKEKRKTHLKFHFLENPDPMDWNETIQKLNPEHTLVLVITKSGNTFETIAQFLTAKNWLGPDRLQSNLVCITDPEKGDLRKFATDHQVPTLSIHPGMGGRFSVFSPVGLFPLCLMGLNPTEFLKGATQVRDSFEKTPIEKNPLFILAHSLIALQKQHPIHVFMPYSSRLKILGQWFVQLWGESLGKNGKGFTPLSAVGPQDQHSILQLLNEGPNDKVTWFLTLDQFSEDVKVPKFTSKAIHTYSSFSQIENHNFSELMHIEQQATSKVLAKAGRPQLNWGIDRLDEKSLGALMFSLCSLTAIIGTLMDINPFDQPGVEEGKIYIREMLQASRKESIDALIQEENSAVARLRREPS